MAVADHLRPRRRFLPAGLVMFLREQPVAAAGLLVILVIAFAAIFAEWLSPYDPVAVDFLAMLAPPSVEHPLGTDTFGRDMLSRIIYGARTALVIGFASSFIGCTIGALIGAGSAYFGGRVDMIVQRFVEILLIIPIIVTALVAVSVLGRNRVGAVDLNLIFAIAIPMVPNVARVIRAAALSLRDLPYVDAARALGYRPLRIILVHMMPNLMAPFLVLLTAYVGQAILLGAALAFIGLGVAEPNPDWGLMLSGASSDFYREAPWAVLAPGLAITITVFAFNLFGDGLRDFLDPRLKR